VRAVVLLAGAVFAALACSGSPPVVTAEEEAMKWKAPGVGDLAPDFTLPDQDRNAVTLSGFRGESNVVLAFYVLAFTGG